MDKDGYLIYLQSLGNQEHYIGSIQKLVALEQELKISLDDYVPYNEDYSKSEKLHSILPTEITYDEPLMFAINSYTVSVKRRK